METSGTGWWLRLAAADPMELEGQRGRCSPQLKTRRCTGVRRDAPIGPPQSAKRGGKGREELTSHRQLECYAFPPRWTRWAQVRHPPPTDGGGKSTWRLKIGWDRLVICASCLEQMRRADTSRWRRRPSRADSAGVCRELTARTSVVDSWRMPGAAAGQMGSMWPDGKHVAR